MGTADKNVFGRTYRTRDETVEYATIRTVDGYAVVRRAAASFLVAVATPERWFRFDEHGGSAAARVAAAEYARKLARGEVSHGR